MYILGINAYHGDAAAALIKDGEIIAAAEEERFNRIKHCAGFPAEAIRYCLRTAGVTIEDVVHIGISRDPSAHLHKKILFAAQRASRQIVGSGQWAAGSKSASITKHAERGMRGALARGISPTPGSPAGQPGWGGAVSEGSDQDEAAGITENGNGHNRGVLRQFADRLSNAAKVRDVKSELAAALGVSKSKLRATFHNIEHHRAHLASSFFVSPFERAALVSLDGFGDFISTMWGAGGENSIEVLGQVEYPHSLGILYTATTQFLGFPHYGDEGKVMGLAPHGQPRYLEQFRDLVRTEANGQFRLNLKYFRHHVEGVEMSWSDGSPKIGRIYSDEYERAFGRPRNEAEPLTDRDRDLAASLQLRLEEVAFHVLRHAHEVTGSTDLGLAGGVAYNSVMNGKILLNTPFRRVFIQPAAGDSGTALGVCYQIWNQLLKQPRREVMAGAYTGPEYSDEEIRQALEESKLEFETLSDDRLQACAARDLADGSIVGWFQGRMEFGPRALGNRSILADPRRAEMKDRLNQRIKKRESFRPFAPAILEEQIGDYFEQTHPSPAMLMVYKIKPDCRAKIPAVTHTDGSGRLQTVSRATNPRFYRLIEDFYNLTGVPLVLNTSFNENVLRGMRLSVS